MNYWQVAAGDGRRDYSDVFLKYGCMLIGPGQYGNYRDNSEPYNDDRLISKSDVAAIKAFVRTVKEDDIVVLKRPSGNLWEVIAVGTVSTDYRFEPRFDDVEGWDLSHRRAVKWLKPKKGQEIISGLTRGTFKGINKQSTIQKIEKMMKSGYSVPTEETPENLGELSDDDLIDILIDNGLRPKDAEDFTNTIHRIRRLVKWYYKYKIIVGEHETRTFLIIPLLLALGWPEQKLKIEWNHIDIAFFEKIYNEENKDSNNCIIILESKKLWDGLSPATSQAEEYASKYPKCKKRIVSDGCCYKLFKREGKTWKYTAYLNILKPKLKHPYEPKVGGAPDVFLSLMGR